MKHKIFESNPQLKQVHVTADGECFYNDNDAKMHAKSLEDKKVELVLNPDHLEVVGEEIDEASKEEVTTDAPATKEAPKEKVTTAVPATEEATKEEVTTAAPATEEVPKEEVTTAVPATEEATKEEVTTAVPATEEVTKEEVTTDAPATEEAQKVVKPSKNTK